VYCVLINEFRNFDKVVKRAYRWLSDNYQDGDRIFLFGEICLAIYIYPCRAFSHWSNDRVGFSRGAYQVRALAGMINKVGTRRSVQD
jgi:uncharacterized protein (DUF2235 family)